MVITSLRLVNYRNYTELVLRPEPGLNVLAGENAAGKTNVLEAIFLMALGRSHRTAKDSELMMSGAQMSAVDVGVDTRGGTRQLGCRMAAGERKKLYIDGAQLSRTGELMGCLNVVMFAPEDLSLVKDGPGERRRFMDMEISQLSPGYYYKLQQYNQVLKQRNALLKDEDPLSSGTLELWDEQLSVMGSAIILERADFMERVAQQAHTMHLKLSGNRETLLVQYQPNVPPADKVHLIEAIRDALADSVERDVYRGYTSVGPHRDDILLALDGTDVRSYGSQGQQRTVVLSLKLSVLELLRSDMGVTPVLLLDDVFSELDKNRQRLLIQAAQGCQTFITCTDVDELVHAGADDMQVYKVADGSITEA